MDIKRFFVAALLALAGGFALAGCSSESDAQQTAKDASIPVSARLVAVAKLTDQQRLEDVAMNGADPFVRVAAADKLDERHQSTARAVFVDLAMHDPDPDFRRAMFARLTDPPPDTLVFIAKVAPDADIRLAAVEQLTDEDSLLEIMGTARDMNVRQAAVTRIADPARLAEIAMGDRIDVHEAAVETLTDQALLAQIAAACTYEPTRLAALNKLTDQTVIAGIARSNNNFNQKVAEIAVGKLTDQALLASIAKLTDNEALPFVRVAAVNRLTDQTALDDLAKNNSNRFVRDAAKTRLTHLRRQQELREQQE